MELRTGVEIEAGPAAERATPAHVKKIIDRFNAIQAAIDSGDSAVDEDFAFPLCDCHCHRKSAVHALPEYSAASRSAPIDLKGADLAERRIQLDIFQEGARADRSGDPGR